MIGSEVDSNLRFSQLDIVSKKRVARWILWVSTYALCIVLFGCGCAAPEQIRQQYPAIAMLNCDDIDEQEEDSSAVLNMAPAHISLGTETDQDGSTVVVFRAHEISMPTSLTLQVDRAQHNFIDLNLDARFIVMPETGFVSQVVMESDLPFIPLKDSRTVVNGVTLLRYPKYGLQFTLSLVCNHVEDAPASYCLIGRVRFLRFIVDFDTPYYSDLRPFDEKDLWDRDVAVSDGFALQSSVQLKSLPYISSGWISSTCSIDGLNDLFFDSAWILQLNDEELADVNVEFVLFDGIIVPSDSE